jgi:DNA-binding NarL/FixJ family response regulator
MKLSILVMGGRPAQENAAVLLRRAVAGAGLGTPALEIPDELMADVSVLEAHMQPFKARDLVSVIRGHFVDARVAYVTGATAAENLSNAIAARAADYLTRPSDPQEDVCVLIILQAQPLPAAGRREMESPAPVPAEPDVALTAIEREVVRRLVGGCTDQEIAAELYLSRRTVQNHLARIRLKTGLRRRADLLRWAARRATA